MALYVVGAILSLIVILREIPGGWAHVAAFSGAAGKFQVFNFGFSWTQPYTFWAGVIGGCFLTTASHGTEQLLVQRLLAARDLRQSRAALMASWVVIFIQFTLFLIIGVCLYTLYSDHRWNPPVVLDKIYPLFIWEHLPAGIAGLVIAAILAAAMSNLSAALNSLSSTTVMDFIKPSTTESGLRLARLATIFWAVVLFGVGLLARHWGSVLQAGLSIASIIYGSLLGVFLLGLLTRRVGEIAAMWAMSTGLALMLYIFFKTPIAWTWYVLIGTSATFLTGLAASFILKEKSRAES
jgi:solute:Na+ symporter, SSS family